MEAGGPRVAVDVALRITRALRRMRELLLQESKVRGDFHSGSEVSPEGAGLQGGEEGVEFGEVGALAGSVFLDGFDDGGEAVLEVERGERKPRLVELGLVELSAGRATYVLAEVIVTKSAVQVFYLDRLCRSQHMRVVVDPRWTVDAVRHSPSRVTEMSSILCYQD